MAAYPEIPIGMAAFARRPDDGRLHMRAGNGALHTQGQWPPGYGTFVIPHVMITGAQLAELQAFYASEASNVEFVDPVSGVSYIGKLTRPPTIVKRHNQVFCDAEMYFVGLAGTRYPLIPLDLNFLEES